MLKKILSTLFCFSLLIPFTSTVAEASTMENNNKTEIQSENSDYWREKFNSYDEFLNTNKDSKLVGEDEIYVKYTLKPNADPNSKLLNESNYTTTAHTKEEYELEQSRRASIGPSTPVNPEPRWLRLNLQVYQSNSRNFMAHSFWEWKTKPVFLFTDLSGIYVSEGMVIPVSSDLISEYVQERENSYPTHTLTPIDVNEKSNGMMGIIDINGGSEINPVTKHMGMTQTPLYHSNTGNTKIIVHAKYIHKQIAFGSPSFDLAGGPSFGLEVSTDDHSVRVEINS